MLHPSLPPSLPPSSALLHHPSTNWSYWWAFSCAGQAPDAPLSCVSVCLCIPLHIEPLCSDTVHGKGHWGPSSRVLSPLQLCSTVPLPHIFWSFASSSAASWLLAALVILHGWKHFWPVPEPYTNAKPSCPHSASSSLPAAATGLQGVQPCTPSPNLQNSA